MAKTHTILEVLVASPSDVADERKILEDVVSEFNTTWGDKNRVRLELVKWETHSRPGFGQDAQDVINQQVGDTYDIFLGIMWGRFGTQTGRAESGTEEEFNRAYSRLKEAPTSVQVMFYFKDAGIQPSKIDSDQLAKVQAFKVRIAEQYGALYHEFETKDDFQTKVRIHLSKAVQDWLHSNSATVDSKTVIEDFQDEADSYNPLANLAALENEDDEDGLLDLVERASDAMAEVVSVVEKMTVATNGLGKKFQQRTDEAHDLKSGGKKPDAKAAKRIANRAANDLKVFVHRLSVEIPEFHKQHSLAMETFAKVAMISDADFKPESKDTQAALGQIREYRAAMASATEGLCVFRATTSDLPRMTTAFNRERRRAVAIMDDLLAQLRVASNQSEDVEQLLDRLLNDNVGSSQ